jgi:hypothetical protein
MQTQATANFALPDLQARGGPFVISFLINSLHAPWEAGKLVVLGFLSGVRYH